MGRKPQNKGKLKKYLGQHLLVDEEAQRGIVAALDPSLWKLLLEIGPGKGAITDHLIDRKFNLKLVEVDPVMVRFLKSKYDFTDEDVIWKNFLKTDLSQYGDSIGVVGNFPYNISSQIVFHIIDHMDIINEMVGTFQKEVARRFASPHGNKEYGILSVLSQAYFEVDYLFELPPSSFDPPPEVDSAVIRLRTKERDSFDRELLHKIVKAAFGKRRKTMRNAVTFIDWDEVEPEWAGLRAEQLSVEQFIQLTKKYASFVK